MIKIIRFGAPWCQPCNMLAPILVELQKEMINVKFEFVDVDKDPQRASEFGVMGIPHTFILKDNKIVADCIGIKPKSYFVNIINDLKES